MQPTNTAALGKLAQLPLVAVHALLDSPDLKAASENTVIAAVIHTGSVRRVELQP